MDAFGNSEFSVMQGASSGRDGSRHLAFVKRELCPAATTGSVSSSPGVRLVCRRLSTRSRAQREARHCAPSAVTSGAKGFVKSLAQPIRKHNI